MRTVFLDTVGLLATWDSTDQWHQAASRALDEIGTNVRTVTTGYILLECANAASRHPFPKLVDQMRAKLEAGQKLIVPGPDDWNQAWAAYRIGKPGDPGIVDQVSFIVMRRHGITDAFTNDRHFKAAGFNTLF